MNKEHKFHRLSVQLIGMTVLLFIAGTAIGAVLLFNGSRDMYLQAKDDMISYDLKELGKSIEESVCVDWFTEYCRNHDDYKQRPSTEEYEMVSNIQSEHGLYEADIQTKNKIYRSLDQNQQTAFAKYEFMLLGNYLGSMFLDSDYEKLYCIDIGTEDLGFVYCDTVKIPKQELPDGELPVADIMVSGVTWDYKESDHPAIEKLRSGSKDIQFEIAAIDSSKDATSYIGYIPIGSENEAAICISYDWAPFRDQLVSKVRMLVLVLLGAMLLTCLLIMTFLNNIVIKPLNTVENAMRDYMEEKDSAKVKEKLAAVKTKNEISKLSGNVEDLTVEMDSYIKSIKRLTSEVMEALAHTIDAKDKYTNGHSFRVAVYSRMLAKELGLSVKEQDAIYDMGLLHDIGKIGIPGTIINKTTKLTDEEYEIIKQHPIYGYEILAEIESMPELSTGARYHHERIDGKGYPDGLKGDEIPFMARIIAVADSYDTMTSNRSYRKYLPQDVVRAEIEKNIGTQFDEAPARAMLKIIDNDRNYMLHE